MSTFNINDQEDISKKKNITYSYGSNLVYNSVISEVKPNNNKFYLSMDYRFANGTTNVSYKDDYGDVINYTSNKLYMFGLLHNNISGITDTNTDVIGELIIENIDIKTSTKLYTCFLIKQDLSPISKSNDIDNIVAMHRSTTIQSASTQLTTSHPGDKTGTTVPQTIPTQSKCIIYNDLQANGAINKIVVFIDPVLVKSETADYIKTLYSDTSPLFSIDAPNQKSILDDNNISTGDDDIYIDCSPTTPEGQLDKTVNTYSIPIDGEGNAKTQESDFMKTSVNFYVFIIGLVFIYFTIPGLYRLIVIKNVNKQMGGGTDSLLRIRSADIFITILFFIGIVVSFSNGFSSNDYNLVTFGMFLSVLFGLSFTLVQINKTTSEDFLKDGLPNESKYFPSYKGFAPKALEMLEDGGEFLFVSLFSVFLDRSFWTILFGLGIFFTLCMTPVFITGDSQKISYYSKISYGALLPLVTSFVYLVINSQ